MRLTEEQEQVIAHPDGHHGKVLAVAGSGKTTTMAYRIRHLIQERGVKPHQIQVLMFNRLAREQFLDTLAAAGLTESQHPPVNTFHSYAYHLIDALGYQLWVGKTEDQAHLCLLRARNSVCKQLGLDETDLDLERAHQAIGLWKGALIPPDRAGYQDEHAAGYVALYREFETGRQRVNAITYDDYLPLAVARLEASPQLQRTKAHHVRYLIVDEYQDVNLGQQRLIEILARGGADLMVVGDDDQTIYEWRGARSDYILGEFETTFTNKPHRVYKLTRSFRFGYCIAQTGYNVIQHNAHRLDKHLISHDPGSRSDVTLILDLDEPGGYANRSLVEEIITLVRTQSVSLDDIRVLARTHAQLTAMQTELLLKQVPFKVIGKAPFLQAGESQALLNYVRVAARMHQPLAPDTSRQFLTIANKPSRYLKRVEVQNMLSAGERAGWTLEALLTNTTNDLSQFNTGSARRHLIELLEILQLLQHKLMAGTKAGPVMAWVDDTVGFRPYYEDYYGPGESSLTRMETVMKFIEYAHETGLGWQDFIAHVDNTDTTQGQPDSVCLKMMTIHSAKGLEFDYVFIPDCKEGYLPVIGSNDDPTYDTQEPRRAPKAAEWIENERRLFYVAATRAKKELFIGAPQIQSQRDRQAKGGSKQRMKSSRFLEEMELEPTRAIASEIRRAATGQDHQLPEACRRWSAFHHIVGRVKDEYRQALPQWLHSVLATVQLSNAARPFGYRQEYDSPYARSSKTARHNRESAQSTQDIWGHIDTRWKPRAASRRDDDLAVGGAEVFSSAATDKTESPSVGKRRADPVERKERIAEIKKRWEQTRGSSDRNRNQANRKVTLESLHVGEVRQGTVRTIRNFGAFVDLGGIEGLLHVSEIDWERVRHPRDLLSEGDEVEVKILDIDHAKGHIRLSRKALQETPWSSVPQRYRVGAVVWVDITTKKDFGAFARLEPGVEGLVRVSEVAPASESNPMGTIQEGDRLEVKILHIDVPNQRIGLSRRQVLEPH